MSAAGPYLLITYENSPCTACQALMDYLDLQCPQSFRWLPPSRLVGRVRHAGGVRACWALAPECRVNDLQQPASESGPRCVVYCLHPEPRCSAIRVT